MKCLSAKQIEFGRFVWGEGVHHYLVWFMTVTSRCILYCEQRMKCLSAKQIEFGRFVWGEGVHHCLVWFKDLLPDVSCIVNNV